MWPLGRSGGRPRPVSKGREFVGSMLVAVVLFLILRTFVLQAFRIPSGSMEETLLIGDFLFINKLEYGARVPFTSFRLPGFRQPRPGDIIVFRFPGSGKAGQRKVDYIKRCVAVGGQRVEMRGKQLYVDGARQDESYAQYRSPHAPPQYVSFGPLTVPPGHLFVMGDNRDHSSDSRFWGTLPMEFVHGRAFVRYFSWDPEAKRIRLRRIFTPVR
ncbi:MAG: signal peptidase I [Candidatus Eisenbacteria sp.]|nr:signal peptidase I [Candidatus Eisenbacteria bacterium]